MMLMRIVEFISLIFSILEYNDEVHLLWIIKNMSGSKQLSFSIQSKPRRHYFIFLIKLTRFNSFRAY